MYKIIATSTFGVESVVADEVKALGYRDVTVENGKIMFQGTIEDFCRANLWLRSANRVKICVGEFTATTFDELFEGAKALPWNDLLPKDGEFPVVGRSVKSTLSSVPACQSIVKKAIVEKMKKTYRLETFPETGAFFRVEVALLKDLATLTLDTSGEALHRRGYRKLSGEAPMKETMAAALILLAKWRPDQVLHDPFCGSGTIPIEAALIGRNIAPGLHREFACEKWPWVSEKIWKTLREEATERIDKEIELQIMGTDIDGDVLKVARENASCAQVSEDIHFQQLPVVDISTKKKYGKIICNPPYGERLGEQEDLQQMYREMGATFRKLDTWSFYILSGLPEFERLFGKAATKRRKLFNGNLRVDFFQYFGPRPPRR